MLVAALGTEAKRKTLEEIGAAEFMVFEAALGARRTKEPGLSRKRSAQRPPVGKKYKQR